MFSASIQPFSTLFSLLNPESSARSHEFPFKAPKTQTKRELAHIKRSAKYQQSSQFTKEENSRGPSNGPSIPQSTVLSATENGQNSTDPLPSRAASALFASRFHTILDAEKYSGPLIRGVLLYNSGAAVHQLEQNYHHRLHS